MELKTYDPSIVEPHWEKHWLENNTFTPDMNSDAEPYSIVIPPPNVTGALHIGHAFNLTLQDILCRHARQLGKKVVWIPGTDHAGIATQNVVERALAKEGKTRHDLGREKFIEKVWDWKEEYGNRILHQIRRIGASVDWSREAFTMNPNLAKAVRKVFVQLYNEDLIYKDKYIINWCTRCHTALADDEVEHENRKDNIWHIAYKVVDDNHQPTGETITIATTRPETIVADTAVCVHPEDERYKHLIGKKVLVPVINREVTVIADNYVDIEFGTGALKVTPSHDHNDWNLGHAHNLEFIQAIDDNGLMNENAGKYEGMSKEDCRKAIVEDIEALEQLIEIKPIDHAVGVCYRCKTVVEPHVSTQWFVATTKIAPRARAAVPSEIKMIPDTWEKTYYNWLDNIRDWCISRQIWWGHRIPAWTCLDCNELIVSETDVTCCSKCNSTNVEQDPDVLDTWFSSALWPFSTFGYPEQTEDLKTFYPTSVLVTSFDILFFWVARMIMMGQHFMDEIPFKEVYFTALVRDASGQKMSKSKGNGIDPVEMSDKYGTDSLRFTLASLAAMVRDIKLSEPRIENSRNFMNKLWNAARFSLMNLEGYKKDENFKPENIPASQVHHVWILHRLEELKKETKQGIAAYRFNDVAQNLYKFLWSEFCDWYLELVKADLKEEGEKKQIAQEVLNLVLNEYLTLFHPIAPFITCQIYASLPNNVGKDLATELFPQERPECLRPDVVDDMLFIQDSISAVRTIRSELNINAGFKLTVMVKPENVHQANLLDSARGWLSFMAKVEHFIVDDGREVPKASASQIVKKCEIIVFLENAIDFGTELARLEKELVKVQKEHAMLSGKLKNEKYVANAPADLVAADKARVSELEVALEKIGELKAKFSALV